MKLHEIETAVKLASELGMKPFAIAEVMRRARRHDRMAETACNRPLTEREKKAIKTNERAIRALFTGPGRNPDLAPVVKFEGDPRGYTVRVFLPSGAYNTWGGAESGWGI